VCDAQECAAPACDDGVRNGDESDVDCGGACDDCEDGEACGGDDDCESGVCVDDVCGRVRSCLEILNAGRSVGDGVYEIDADGAGGNAPFEVVCDMSTDEGGWTEITLATAALGFGAAMVAVEAAGIEGIDGEHRPFTRDGAGQHTYHYTIEFPAGFAAFYLQDYQLRANGSSAGNTADINPDLFAQQVWDNAVRAGGVGDVSFGAANEAGPTTSFGRTLADRFDCHDCVLGWPEGAQIYELEGEATQLRIGWGETGPQHEGWYPWWSGTIRVR